MDSTKIKEFFDGLSPSWDERMVDYSLSISKILDVLSPMVGKDVLDVGCGTGVLVPFLKERKAGHIDEIDISCGMMEINEKKHGGADGLGFLCGDASSYVFPRMYDRIIIYNAFPHFEDRHKLIRHLSSVLKNDGILAIAHSRTHFEINIHHGGLTNDIASLLPPASELSDLLSEFLSMVEYHESGYYMVWGRGR